MYKVMIIDDEPWVLARLKSMCNWRDMGFSIVAEADDSASAWLLMQEHEPDVVFTDINMPGFSGLDILETARKHGVTAEFVIVSGYDDFSYAQKAIEGGVFHYFLKPLDADEFVSVLMKLKKKLDSKMPRGTDALDQRSIPITESDCLNSIILYIHSNYTQQFGLGELSGEFYVSQTYICDLFNKYLGTTFIKYLNSVRLEQAERLLSRSASPVSHVALETGFKDYSYFSKLFKKQYGLTPSEYRARNGRGGKA